MSNPLLAAMPHAADLPSLSSPEVNAFRLHRHHLERRAGRSELVDVVRDTCGIQSQVPSAADLALRARLKGLRRDDIRRALEVERTLVRGWTVRFTVHVIPAEDFLLYTRALSARVARTLRWMARHGRSAEEIETMVGGIAKSLSDRPLTRHELAERVAAILGERFRERIEHSWGGSVVEACLRGLVCFGPDQGNQITFVSRERWLPDAKDFAVREAGGILLRRYLSAFGPATQQDFQRWAEIPMSEVRAIWGELEGDLSGVRVDGRPHWMLSNDLRNLKRRKGASGVVNLLPSFDAYLLGHRDKSHLVDAAKYKRVYRKAGWLSPVVLIDGRVAGVWTHKEHRGRRLVSVERFRSLNRAEREGVAAEAEDLGRFLGGYADVAYTR